MTLLTAPAPSTDVDIQRFLEREGFVGDALQRARTILEAAGLTRPGKRRIAEIKLDRARDVLRTQLIRVCHRKACRDVDDPRPRVFVPAPSCELCGGSPNRRAGDLARQAMLGAGYRRLLVVGGTPTTQAALIESLGSPLLEIRCIDGTQGTRSAYTVEADLDWADVLVIWATTPLPHKISLPYTSRAPGRLPWITVPRRGVEAVCNELVRLTQPPSPARKLLHDFLVQSPHRDVGR